MYTEVGILRPEPSTPFSRSAASILERLMSQRCSAKVVSNTKAACTVELLGDPHLQSEAFRIVSPTFGIIQIRGGGERGLLYGVGKFFRTSRFDENGFSPSEWRGTSSPKCPVRAVYLATHFNNYYEAAPLEEVVRYVQDLELWGYNTLVIHYPTWQFGGFSDPASVAWLGRFKTLFAEAKRCGLQVGLVQVPNDGFAPVPPHLAKTKVPGRRRGNFGQGRCTSKPAAREEVLRLYRFLLDEFGDVGLDLFVFWPYDEGGCACEHCWPWGARGYLSISKEFASHVRERYPSCRIVLSTWCFENEDDRNPDGEWVGLAAALKEDRAWVDYLMADGHNDYFPKYLLENETPCGLPILNFPEISMFGMEPWGGYGANPAPRHFQTLWDRIKHKAAGGAPYSEGIYEDMNKAVIAGFYWDPDRRAEDTIKEYIGSEFSPDAVELLSETVRILERNHHRTNITAEALRAFENVTATEKLLADQVRGGWRWRIFYLRALIDKELYERKGKLEGAELRQAFEELTHLYHVENAHSKPIKPPQVP